MKAANATAADAAAQAPGTEMIAVTLGGTTRMIRRDEVRYVQAQGDYARLHTDEASFLVRVPMADLERQWADAGFVRVHRSYLVSLSHVTRVRLGSERPTITVGAGRTAREPAPAARPSRPPGGGDPAAEAVSDSPPDPRPAQRVRVTAPRAGAPAASVRPAPRPPGDAEAPTSDIAGRLRALPHPLAAAHRARVRRRVRRRRRHCSRSRSRSRPRSTRRSSRGVPVSWLLLAVGVYPLALTVAALYVRAASRNESRYRSLDVRRGAQ